MARMYKQAGRLPIFVLLMVCAVGLGLLGASSSGKGSFTTEVAPAAPADEDYLIPNVFADIAEKTLPSVVTVYVMQDARAARDQIRRQMQRAPERFRQDPQLRRFFEEFGQDREGDEADDPHADLPDQVRTALGSGVIISKDGFIITNHHIIRSALTRSGELEGGIKIVLHDETEIESDKVKLVEVDTLLDLAILKIDPKGLNLKPLEWGDSDKLRIGDWVVAIGNPLDLRGTVSKGIVSAKGRQIGMTGIEHLIQTDAMINPGNSGGALVNIQGELIGINMAIETTTGYFQGIGFAIPSNDVRFVVDEVIEWGRVQRGYIGIEMQSLRGDENKTLRSGLGLDEDQTGIIVTRVVPDQPADRAGVQEDDIITYVDGVDIDHTSGLLEIIAGKKVDQRASLTILRSDRKGKLSEKKLTMTLGERPSDRELRNQRQYPRMVNARRAQEAKGPGLKLRPFSEGEVKGLVIEEVQERSRGARAMLREGDIVLEVNRMAVKTLKDYDEALKNPVDERPHLVRYLRILETGSIEHRYTAIARDDGQDG